jgi:hypothetical protein
MSTTDDLRLVTLLAACEMALVRRDAMAGPLLRQAARAAAGRPEHDPVRTAADIAQSVDLADRDEASAAARKVTQALCRWAAQTAQAAALGDRITDDPQGGTTEL